MKFIESLCAAMKNYLSSNDSLLLNNISLFQGFFAIRARR